jgi:hypothetical protein
MALKQIKKQPRRVGLSDQTKKILLGSSAGVLVVVAGVWAYYTFTTVAPPKLDTATAKQVVDYLGTDRGFTRLNYDNREKFMGDMWNQFGKGDNREQLAQAFDKMTPAEQEVFVDAVFETAKDRFLKQAVTYSDLPVHERKEFLDTAINNLETLRLSIGGAGPGGGSGGVSGGGRTNIAKPFERCMPKSTDGMTKMLVDRTSPRQRTKAQPLFDAIAVRYKEREQQRR